MKTTLFFIAFLGWILSVVIHITAMTGEDLSVKYPFVMALHVGIFVVWFPTVLYLKNDKDYRQLQQSGFLTRSNPITFFKILFKNTPTFLKMIAIAGFVYAPINFLIPFTESSSEINSTRMFSGHWIAFYGIAVGVLYPFKKAVVL